MKIEELVEEEMERRGTTKSTTERELIQAIVLEKIEEAKKHA